MLRMRAHIAIYYINQHIQVIWKNQIVQMYTVTLLCVLIAAWRVLPVESKRIHHAQDIDKIIHVSTEFDTASMNKKRMQLFTGEQCQSSW